MKKIYIGVFSPRLNKNHIVFYESLSVLFDSNEYIVNFFINNWFENKIKKKNSNNYFYNYNNELFFYIKNIFKLKKVDYLIIEPETSKLLLIFFTFITNLKFSLVVHNANYWVNPLKNNGFKNYLIKKLNNIIFKKAKSIIVVNSNVKKYINKYTTKKIFYFPFNYYTKSKLLNNTKSESNINFVVPGNITSKRRDYEMLLKCFKNVLISRNDIQLVLLGKIDKNESDIINTLNEIKINYPNNISFWDRFIEDSEYNFYIDNATLFIAPLIQYHYTSMSIEEYGTTKETGVTSFIREQNKLCFAPNFISFEEDINHLILKYNNIDDLFNLFINFEITQTNENLISDNSIYNKNVNDEIKLFSNS